MDEAILDRLTLHLLDGISGNPERDLSEFKQSRDAATSRPPDTGHARSSGYGNVFQNIEEVRAIATFAWKTAETWWQHNGGHVEAAAMVHAIFAAVHGSPTTRSIEVRSKDGGPGLNAEELAGVVRKVAEQVAVLFAERHRPGTGSQDGDEQT